MAITLADLKVVLDADTPATGKIQDTDRAVSDFAETADRASGPTTSLFSKVSGGALEFAKAVPGIAMLAGGIGDLASGMVAGNAEFERYETQFGVLLGSADAAKDRLAELAEFGAKTPFELPEIVKADKVLTAFGLSSEKTAEKFGVSGTQIRTTIGDIAAGTGASFEELAGTFGKFASGATGDAISRFQEMGIATREEMASWGIEFNKAGQMTMPVNEAFGILEQNVRAKFGGMMDAQSGTFEGMVSNLQDWMGATQRQLAAPLFEVLKEKLQGLIGFLGSPEVQAGMASFAEGLASGIGIAIDVITRLSDILGPLLGMVMPIVTGFLGLGTGAEGVAGPLGSVTGLLGELSGIASGLNDALVEVTAGFSAGGLQGAFDALVANIPNLLGGLQEIGFTIAGQAVEWALQLVKWVGDAIPGLVSNLAEFGAAIFSWITSEGIPRAAEFLMQMAQKFIDFIVPAIPGIVAKLQEFGSALLGWILNEGIPQAFNMLVELGTKFVEWVAPNIPPLLEALGGMLASLTGWLIGEALPMIISKLLEWGKAFVDWLGPNIPILLEELANLLGALGSWLLETALPELGANLLEWGKAFVDWVGPQIPPLLQSLGEMLGEILDWIVSDALPAAVDKAGELGAGLISGIIDGLKSAGGQVVDFLLDLMSGALDEVKKFFGISSPSRLMRDMFRDDVIGGASLGTKEGGPKLIDSMRATMGATVTATEALAPSLARSILPPTNTRAVGLLGSTGGTSAGGGVVINAPITINGLQGDIQNPETWKMVIRPIMQAAQSYLGPNVILTARTI